MPKVQVIADPNYVINQYQNASNLNARVRLHQEFSTNPYGWQHWLFDKIKLHIHSRVLELGAGPGYLWYENSDRVPEGLEISVSDLSIGMLKQARQNLSHSPSSFRLEVIDAQSIPSASHSFDIVIANNMLYHVPDVDKALMEIKRILKPGGYFYAATGGSNHLKELSDLISRFDNRLTSRVNLYSDSFNLENGSAILSSYFSRTAVLRYTDALIVTDADLLTDYILSGRLELSAYEKLDLARFVAQELKRNDGKLYISKDSGVFELSG